jgi:hypothetical protein
MVFTSNSTQMTSQVLGKKQAVYDKSSIVLVMSLVLIFSGCKLDF